MLSALENVGVFRDNNKQSHPVGPYSPPGAYTRFDSFKNDMPEVRETSQKEEGNNENMRNLISRVKTISNMVVSNFTAAVTNSASRYQGKPRTLSSPLLGQTTHTLETSD